MPNLPQDWIQLPSDPARTNIAEIEAAFDLLKGTFPYRHNYQNLDLGIILRKMGSRHSPETGYVSGLRIFRRKPAGAAALDMCVFFFLRLLESSAYCLTAGVRDGGGMTGQILHDNIVGVCKHMYQDILNSTMQIEVVNEFDLPGDLPNLPAANIIRDAFVVARDSASTAAGHLTTNLPDIYPDRAWPPHLKRWLVNNLNLP